MQGRGDRGADLLVDFEVVPIPGLVQSLTLAVQVKSYEGSQDGPGAVEDLRRAFDHYEAEGGPVHMGLVVSTASQAGERLVQAAEELASQTRKPVSVLLGKDLAEFFLRYAGDLFGLKDSTPSNT